MYNLTIQLTKDDLFESSLNYAKHSKTFFFDIIFTLAALIATIYTIFNKIFFELTDLKKILLIFCCILFPIIQPIILYIKSCNHAKRIKDLSITLEFDNDKIIVYSDKERSEVLYENVYNFIKYKNMIVIMYDSIHGQIIPNRVFDNNRDEFYDYVSERIKYAREKQKEKNN